METRTNIFYRTIVMLLCIAITSATLNQFAKLIQHLITIKYDWKFELSMVVGQLGFQLPFIYRRTNEDKMSYYFNMLLVSMIGSVLLIPVIIFNHFYLLSDVVNVLYFLWLSCLCFSSIKKGLEPFIYLHTYHTPGCFIAF